MIYDQALLFIRNKNGDGRKAERQIVDQIDYNKDTFKDAMNDDRDFGFMHDYESSHANKKDHIAMASIIGYILSFRYSSWNLIYLVQIFSYICSGS